MAKAIALSTIAERIGGRVIGDAERLVEGVRPLRSAGEAHLTFVQHPREKKHHVCKAGAVLMSFDEAAQSAHLWPCDVICTDEVERKLIDVLALFTGVQHGKRGIHKSAVVSEDADIDADAYVGPFAVIGAARIEKDVEIEAHVFIGDDVSIDVGTKVSPHAIVLSNTRIGKHVRIASGAVVGGSGFGFAPEGERNIFVPQVGVTLVGDDVSIGANTCIDRGALDHTTIARGTKIDNLVQVGHGVTIGENSVLISQSGISGGAELGERVLFGGQSACVQFVQIGDDARIAARAGVTADVAARSAQSGFPSRGHADWLKDMALAKRLPSVMQRLKNNESELALLRERLRALEEERQISKGTNDE